ncbi:MAG: DUF4388 domain-containing protein [Myxococcota bacterium]
MLTAQSKTPSTHEPWDSCLVGDLGTWPLGELLLWLHQTQRTAMVRLGNGLRGGVLFFKHGCLVRCEWGQLGGEEALIGLMGVTQGTFQLIQRDIPDARPNIGRSTPEVLFQCAVAADERARGTRAASTGN